MKAGKQRIFVGLSGGVDSSVAALRLQNAGHDVVGVFIKVWHPPAFPCDWEAERLDAMRVAAKLGIPFITFDAEEIYKQDVADYMIDAYKQGLTPNPDVMCNRAVKFDAFMQFALQHGADGIATGHYAQIDTVKGEPHLLRGVDTEKDQSYFLWTLTEKDLSCTHFPVGDTPKSRIRVEAARHGLNTAEKSDSQGICFLGQIDMKEFLRAYVVAESGDVLLQNGEVIGKHDGALFYTIGQRHGFQTHTDSTKQQPLYVVSKNMEDNTITVSSEQPRIAGAVLTLTNCNWIGTFPEGEDVTVQLRYRQKPMRASITRRNQNTATIELHETVDVPARGQSCVCYRGERCLGGGIIEEVNA